MNIQKIIFIRQPPCEHVALLYNEEEKGKVNMKAMSGKLCVLLL
jgi:hypothetical protein